MSPLASTSASPANANASASRTYQQAMLEQQQHQQQRDTAAIAQLDHQSSAREPNPLPTTADDDDLISMNQLRLEMETLLSLRRHSMNHQPLTLDPDLPPTSPPTSSPPTATSPNPASPSDSTSAGARAGGNRRPHLTLQLAPPTIDTPNGGGGGAGPPVSPTAPTPAETGTLVRRKSSAHGNKHPSSSSAPGGTGAGATSKLKLPSEHPVPVSPTAGLHFPSPFGHPGTLATPPAVASSSSLAAPAADAGPSTSGSATSPPTSPTSYLDIPLSAFGGAPSSSGGGGGGDLFWLPASLHPELAPQEFKAFIREQTTPEALARRSSLSTGRAATTGGGGGAGGAEGAGGGGGTGRGTSHRVSRRASLLRGEYKPRQGDGVGDDHHHQHRPSELMRTASDGNRAGAGGGGSSSRSGAGGNGYYRRGSVINFEQLTIKDLQRLEELAAKAEAEGTTAGEEEEGERLGRVLRRSLSLNPHRVAAAAAEAERLEQQQQQSERLSSLTEEEPGDEAPLIVPPPGQILRRNARTRIRKTSTGSDFGGGARGGSGGGSRFGSGGGGPRRQRTSTGGSDSVESSADGVVDLRASTASSAGGGGGGGSGYGDDALEDDPGTGSVGDHSVEDSVVSYESDEAGFVVRNGVRAPPPSAESASSSEPTGAGAYSATVVPVSSPTSSENQHIEFSDQAGFGLGIGPPDFGDDAKVGGGVVGEGLPSAVGGLEPVVTPSPATRDPVGPLPPAAAGSAVSPASADYDWATHNLQRVEEVPPSPQPPRPPPPPPPATAATAAAEPQYLVHPQHLSRPPFSEVPPVQAVPLPTHEREQPAAHGSPSSPASPASPSLPPRADSPKPAGKKSGWARLGLGRDDDKAKKKGRGGGGGGSSSKDGHHGSPGKEASSPSGGFLGGLFGRKHREENERPPPRAPSPPPEPKIPPPPPTASGVLLPNGRYANFYRLPIHVERAVYRLSHIKLANPRRPLYEQVLISNLMFWYLGLIQKPTTPPAPTAPPVPIPGMRAQQQQQQQQAQTPPPVAPLAVPVPAPAPKDSPKRTGLSKPGRGGRTAETPVRGTSFEVQNQQLVEEQQHRYQQQRQYPQSHEASYTPLQTSNSASNGRSPPTSPPGKGIFAPPLSSSKTVEPPSSSRSPDRASAPANMYPISSAHSTSYEPAGAMDWQYEQQPDQPHRESYPPNRPVPVVTDTVHVDSAGFEVVSRSPAAGGRRVSGGSSHVDEAAILASSSNYSSPHPSAQGRRTSAMSDKSFDASEIYDAYAPASPVNLGADGGSDPFLAHTGPERPAGLVLGAVAPRGSSLKALSGSDP